MKKMLTTLLALVFAVFSVLPVHAAAGTDIVLTPPYFQAEWTSGTREFTIPYSAYYKITLAGGQGANYGGASGSYGITQVKTLWLKEGTIVKYQLGSVGSYSCGSTLSLGGGTRSKLWINDVLQAESAGGPGACNSDSAPDGVTSVVVYSGDNYSSSWAGGVHWHGAATHATEPWQITYYQLNSPGQCYACVGHTHMYTGCEAHELYITMGSHSGSGHGDCPICGRGLEGWHQTEEEGGWDQEGDTEWACAGGHCNDSDNTWVLSCGFENGQITGIPTQSASNSVNNWGADSVTASNSGSGRFIIQLVEQNRLTAKGGLTQQYKTNGTGGLPSAATVVQKVKTDATMAGNRFYNVIVMEYSPTGEHYAAYVKHGNLN